MSTTTTAVPHARARRLLRLNEVKHRVGLQRSTIYHKIKLGEFPAPVRLGARAVAWPSDLIDEWIDARVLAATAQSAGRNSP